MRPVLLFTLLVPLLLHPLLARADSDAVDQAKQRFAAGAQAYREARYKDAIDLFLQANGLDPHPDLIFNVGQAYEKLGDVPAALRSYREYLRLVPGARDRATVETSIKNLEQRLRERGVQQVSIFSSPEGATLILDEKAVGQTPWTGEIAPGRHVAVLRATGFPDVAKEFVLLGDRSMDLDIALSLAAAGSAAISFTAKPAEAPPAPPPVAVPPKRHVQPWTIATLGAGVVGLGAALGLELARQSAQSSAEGDPTQIGYHNAYATMTSDQTAARVLVGVGAALTVTGGVLLALDLRPGASAPPASAGLGCFLGACGASASVRF
jgi:tetratricopeptide (TPR) repeat protein